MLCSLNSYSFTARLGRYMVRRMPLLTASLIATQPLPSCSYTSALNRTTEIVIKIHYSIICLL